MKKIKGILALFLAALFVFTALPICVGAEVATSGSCGEDLTWSFDDIEGILTISGTGDMDSYLYSNEPWYNKRTYIKSVITGDKVTSIGDCAFYSCPNLTSVTIPESVITIGESAFEWCGLADLTISNGVETIKTEAFANCNSLTVVTIPESVSKIGIRAFYDCKALTDIKVSQDNKYYCDMDDVLFNADKTSIIQYPCHKTDEKYIIPDTVTTIEGYAFESCENLTNISIPKSVTTIKYNAFENCIGLTDIIIPDGVSTIPSNTFYNCNNLKSITFGDGVTTIGDAAFEYCKSLTDLTLPSSITKIGRLRI